MGRCSHKDYLKGSSTLDWPDSRLIRTQRIQITVKKAAKIPVLINFGIWAKKTWTVERQPQPAAAVESQNGKEFLAKEHGFASMGISIRYFLQWSDYLEL